MAIVTKKDLDTIIAEYHSLLKGRRRQISLKTSIKETKDRLQLLRDKMDKEYTDIVELESKPIAYVFSKILKSEVKQLEKERQEYLSAILEHKECEKTLKLLEYEQSVLETKLVDETQVKILLDEMLLNNNDFNENQKGQDFQKLKGIIASIHQNIQLETQVEEALSLITDIHLAFREMLEALKMAKENHTWGEFYNEVQLNKTIRKSNLDKAQGNAYVIKKLLILLKPELEDISIIQTQLKVDRAQLFQFNINYYSNLINDWINDVKLSETLTNTMHAYTNISKLMRELKIILEIIQKKKTVLEESRIAYIENIAED